jgi:predicted secreted protein
MSLRDIEALNFEHRIAELSREIIEKDSRIRNLEDAYEKTLLELKDIKAKLPVTKAEIIQLPRK